MSKARRAGAVALVTLMPLVGITAWGGTALAQSNGNSGVSTSSGGNAPPGNNGTIKVDEWTMDNGQDNDPQLPCNLSISFFGYDAGTRTAAMITLTPWAPTAGGHPYLGGTTWTRSSRGNGSTWDANIQISQAQLAANNTFAGITPSHNGYHVRVEAEVNGYRGSDDKFKMVWMSCPTGDHQAEAATTTSSTTSTTVAKSSLPSTPAQTPVSGAAVAAGRSVSSAASTAATADTARIATASAAVPLAGPATPVAAHGLLAFTGANIAALVGLGLLLIAAGCLLVIRRRRRPGPVCSD
jgi:LPXTG-motif cell wall-anchored protein